MTIAERPVFPVRSLGGLLLLLAGGLLATLAFDLYGGALAPAVAPTWRLAPEPLAVQTLLALFGPFRQAEEAGTILHWVTGVVVYPLGYAFVAMPSARGLVRGIPWPVVAVLYGGVLWVVALYGVAHLVAGNPPFLGFGDLAWSALAGHVLYALVLGLVLSPQR